jgi:alpha-L-fucosidase
VSKNGTLLLSIPIKGDGTIDSDETAFLAEMGRWMDVNGEAIFGTRPWNIFGEGPNNIRAGDMGERNVRFTSDDIRFTTKGSVLYAIVLGWPESGKLTIKSLASGSKFYPQEIGKVVMLGSRTKIKSDRTADGLVIDLPARKPAGPTYVFKITTANSKP